MMNNVDEILDQAFIFFNRNDFRQAESLCRDALMISPHHGDGLYLLGLIAYRQHALSVAADLLHQAIELYPNVVNYQLAFAEVLRAEGHLEEALSCYLNYMNDPKVRTEAGLIYLAQGKKKQAKECFKIALKDNPNLSVAYLGLAQLSKTKKEQEALLVQAFSTEANENTAYHLSKYYVGKKEWKKAEAVLKNYLIETRDLTLYGVILEALNRPDEAYEVLKKATERDAYNTGAWVQTGLLLEHQKKWEGAEEAYRKALSLDNTLLLAHEGMSNVLMVQGQYPLALEHTRKIIQQNPNHYPSLYKLALLLEQTGDLDEALGIYFKLLILKQRKFGVEQHIANAIVELSKKKMHLAKRFAKGWVKNFSNSELAKKTWQSLKIVLMVICLTSFSANAYMDEKQLDLVWESRYAEMGDMVSLYNVGEMYEKGIKIPKNLSKAIEYYKRSAEQNYTPAKMALGRLYEFLNNIESAFLYYEQAANDNYVAAQIWMSNYHEKKNELLSAYNWLEKAMRNLFPDAEDLHNVSPKLKELADKLGLKK